MERGRPHRDFARTDSFCPTPEEQLLEIVLKNQDGELEKFFKYKDGDEIARLLNHCYGHPYYRPILYVAIEKGREQAVDVLLKNGADVFWGEPPNNDKQAVHHAVLAGNSKILKSVLEYLDATNANVGVDGETPLIMVAKGKCPANAPLCAKILVDHGVDVNKTDVNGRTAAYWAAKKKQKEVFAAILEGGAICDDATKNLVRKNAWHDLVLPEFSPKTHDPFDLIKKSDEDTFLGLTDLDPNQSSRETTLLQLACQKNLPKIVDFLLESGANPDRVSELNPNKPIVMAAKDGHHQIFSLLLNKTCQIPNDAILELSKRLNNKKFPGIDHEMCFAQIFDCDVKFDHNCTDEWNNTVLHHTSKYGNPEHTKKLLGRGASLACRNDFRQLAIENIDVDTLRSHFDRCVSFDEKTEASEESTITFDYTSLVLPTAQNETNEMSWEDHLIGGGGATPNETDVIGYMSTQKNLRQLLLHPLVSSFIFFKWRLISPIFYTNLVFYGGFCLSLFMYITLTFNTAPEDAILTFYCFLAVTYVMLVLREAFQFLVTPTTYWCSVENAIEVILIVITGFLLTQKTLNDDRSKQLVATVIVLAAFELVLLFGQHPCMSTYVVMLKTVSYNFLKFFLWYFVLIVAFAFSFFILFKDGPETAPSTDKMVEKNETDFFDDPGNSILKTIIMLTGEYDASDIKFETYPLTSRIIFLLFVLTISIILLNLLNGLAVSDTQMIKKDAEIVGLVQRVEHIAYVENLLTGSLLPTVFLVFLQKCCFCNFVGGTESGFFRKKLLKRTLLFPHCDETKKITVNAYTNHTRRANAKKNKPKIYLDKKNLKNTLNWWRTTKKAPNDGEVFVQHCKTALEKITGDLATLRENQNLLVAKLEVLCKNINNNQ